jgi:DnaJ-class molecular chaperone
MNPNEAEHRQLEAESLVEAARDRACERCGGTGQRLIAGAESGLECPDCTTPWAPEPCETCGGEGRMKHRVSKDMAIDAGVPDTEGWEYEDKCSRCLGTGVQ